MKIAIMGAGKWGQALYGAFSQKNDCIISSRTKKEIENFVSIKEVLDCEYIVFAIAAQSVNDFLKNNFTFKNQKILVVSKGIDTNSGRFLHEIFEDFLPKENLAFLSGPSFAVEVSQKLPCALVISSFNQDLAKIWGKSFPDFIKTYVSDDVIGAEVCGAYKNVIAIASGICDGLNLGNNARASLIARGLVEINRFGKFFGAKDETFFGLSGAGDLFLTASSTMSRNYRVGIGLAKNQSLEDILTQIGEIAEGIQSANAIIKIADKYEIYTPIAREVVNILRGKNAKESLKNLLKKN